MPKINTKGHGWSTTRQLHVALVQHQSKMLEWRKGPRDLGGEVDAIHIETNDNHKVDAIEFKQRGNGDIVAGGVRKWQILLEYESKHSSKKRRNVEGGLGVPDPRPRGGAGDEKKQEERNL